MATILIKRPGPKNAKLTDRRKKAAEPVKKAEPQSTMSILKKALPTSLTKVKSVWGNSKKAAY